MGTIRRYKRKVVMVPLSAPKPAKNAQPIMLATRSGTMVCISKVATKKIAPTRANMLASVMLCRKISSRRLKIASIGDVVGVEAQLDQNLCDPEVVRRRVENAIQRGGQVCTAEIHRIPRVPRRSRTFLKAERRLIAAFNREEEVVPKPDREHPGRHAKGICQPLGFREGSVD